MSNKPATPSDTTAPSLPACPEIQTQWDLTMYYDSVHDPRLEQDVVAIEQCYHTFAETYGKKSVLRSARTLRASLDAFFALDEQRLDKPLRYLFYRLEQNAHDTAAEQKKNLVQARLITAQNSVIFYPLLVSQASKTMQATFLRAPELQPYRYVLEQWFADSRYLLSEPEERILRQKSMPARSLWISGTEKILAKRIVSYKKQDLPLLTAIEQVDTLPSREKPRLWHRITESLASVEEVAENELNAVVIDKKITDELRGYTSPEQATIRSYQNDPQTVANLVQAVTKHGFPLSRAFYAYTADQCNETLLPYARRYDEVAALPKFSFEEGVTICREVFYGLRTEYGTLFDRLLSQGHIDAYPTAGKQGGAFMSAGTNEPIMVKLNHVNTLRSLKTLAHEMGHAIHTHRTMQQQPVQYQDYSTTIAETASTLFERVVFQAVYDRADPALRPALLHSKLSNEIATVQRQIAFYNFEMSLHREIREQGGANKETILALFKSELTAYLGDRVEVTDDDARSYVYVGHFRNFFYVYSYAYGHVLSSILHQRYTKDAGYWDAIDSLLSAGSSASVEDLAKQASIDLYDPATFTQGLTAMRRDLTALRKQTTSRREA